MAFANKMASRVKPSSRIFSEQILKRFTDPLDCLTAHLMLECAEVLAGVKPANLISLVNRNQLCGRNLYQLWQSHHEELATRLADLTIKVLQTKERALLLLCYNNTNLSATWPMQASAPCCTRPATRLNPQLKHSWVN